MSDLFTSHEAGTFKIQNLCASFVRIHTLLSPTLQNYLHKQGGRQGLR